MLVQAKCPGCRTVLRIPSEWVNKSVRCKECGMVVRAEKKSAPSPFASFFTKASGTGSADKFDFTATPATARRPPVGRVPTSRYVVGGLAALALIAIAVYLLTPAGENPSSVQPAGQPAG